MRHETGTALPAWEKTFRPFELMAYGAATWDWYNVHYDRTTSDAARLPGPFVDGQQFGALFARQIRQYFGDRAFISAMELRFHSLVHAGDTVLGSAEITAALASGTLEVRQLLTCRGRPVASAVTTVEPTFPAAPSKEQP